MKHNLGYITGKKVLITGATGFVGSNLVRKALSWNSEVYAIVRKKSNIWRIWDIINDISVIDVDLVDYEKLRSSIKEIRPDIIFHTAVYGGSADQSDIHTIMTSNFIGTVNLVQSCMQVNFDVMVNTGSSSEYGIKYRPMKESDQLEPTTDYGVSKAASTLFCYSKAISDELPIVTLRLFSPYGSYESRARLIPSIILSVLRGNPPTISSRNNVRDFIFIDDVIEAYQSVSVLDNPSGMIFNIGSGIQHSVGEVTDTILKYLGPNINYQTGHPQVWRIEPPFWEADITSAKMELHWEPKYSLNNGLIKTIEWFKENINLYN